VLVAQGVAGERPLIDYLEPFPQSLSIRADGAIERIPRVPADLGLERLLARIAGRDDNLDAYFLSPDKLDSCRGRGRALAAQLARRAGPLPAAFEVQLLAGAHAYPPLPARECVAITVHDPLLFEALTAREELRAVFMGAPNGHTLLVAAEGLDVFRAGLAAFGLSTTSAPATTATAGRGFASSPGRAASPGSLAGGTPVHEAGGAVVNRQSRFARRDSAGWLPRHRM